MALQITSRTYVSHSQLSLMRCCPRKFFYTYVEKAPRDYLPVALIYGRAIHASLEGYYRSRMSAPATYEYHRPRQLL